jgi:UDP-2,3-diacylglucosamine pyrophosphatase LpxH
MNWLQRIETAKKTRHFTDDDKQQSILWKTDPIGERHFDIVWAGACQHPADLYLVLDGIYFTDAVHKDDVDFAERLYKSINDRIDVLDYEFHWFRRWLQDRWFMFYILTLQF